MDGFRRDPEEAAQDEVAGLVVPERPPSRLSLYREQPIPVGGIEFPDDVRTQVGEEVVQPEGDSRRARCQIERQPRFLVAAHHDEVECFAVVPDSAEPRLISKAECDRVLEEENIKAARFEHRQHAFFAEKPVGIIGHGDSGDALCEPAQDLVAQPARRRLRRRGAGVHVAPLRVSALSYHLRSFESSWSASRGILFPTARIVA